MLKKLIMCSFLIFYFDLLYLPHSLERAKLWNENIYKCLRILRYIKKTESFNLLYLSHFALQINGLVPI